jgi:hypothetical protein
MDKTLIYGLDWTRVWASPSQDVGGSRQAAKFLKIESFFFSFFLQKYEKFFKILKMDYILVARRVNPPRPGVYFWTSFCPELVKLQLIANRFQRKDLVYLLPMEEIRIRAVQHEEFSTFIVFWYLWHFTYIL